MAVAAHGRRRFRGALLGAQDDATHRRAMTSRPAKRATLLRIADMEDARLVLTDALVAESAPARKARAQDADAAPAQSRTADQVARAAPAAPIKNFQPASAQRRRGPARGD